MTCFLRSHLLRRRPRLVVALSLAVLFCVRVGESSEAASPESKRPNIVLVMADDQGWGQTGYYDHPVLQTPHLDSLAEDGLRFDRFYAAAPVCSPTRASVMTGRTNDRTGVLNHGYPLRHQEVTIADVLQEAGYVTAHFGKWHLNGIRGPGVPILASDSHHPGHFGFDRWLSVTNFFDRDPILSREGKFEEFEGDSSEVVVDEAVKFIDQQAKTDQPFFTVIWYGTPHNPFRASEEDAAAFASLDRQSQHHYGELVALDRSIGTLRRGLKAAGVTDQTLLWYCSDNGGLPGIRPGTVGGLRGHKGDVDEGGLRVPAVVCWPGQVQPRVTSYPASTSDIFPTLVDVVGLDLSSVAPHPLDGISLEPLLKSEIGERPSPIGFRYRGRAAWVDNRYKVVSKDVSKGQVQLFDLVDDPAESNDLSESKPKIAARLGKQLSEWNESVEKSFQGKDYASGRVDPSEPEPRTWTNMEVYQPYFDQWRTRWQYSKRLSGK